MPGMSVGVETLQAAALFVTPVLVAAVGELVVERAGVVNIGIEGMMLAGALAGWVANGYGGPVWGLAAAVGAAVVLALVFAAAALVFAADQIVTGTGINLLAFGATGLAYKRVNGAMADKAITAIDPAWMMGVAVVLVAATWAYLRFTRRGLELTAVGESPEAADSAGVAVNRRRLLALLFGAACAGLAGAYLSTMRVQQFTENMTQGSGFLALAIVIFGRWHPVGVLLAGLFFGVVRAGANWLETRGGVGSGETLQLLKLVPYAVSLLALAGVAGRSGAPAGLGRAYVRE
ncbi:MAG: transporter permease [Conexibacter sp.]|nr:transporter permease [Conexibacter sp.]